MSRLPGMSFLFYFLPALFYLLRMTTDESTRKEQLKRYLDLVCSTWTARHDNAATLCGKAVCAAFELITRLGPSHRARVLAQELVELADDRINSFDYKSVPECWRRLYTDASIALVAIKMQQQDSSQEDACSAAIMVAQLDMAIIIAGAPGPQRHDMVQGLIKCAQKVMPEQYDIAQSPRKRIKLADSQQRKESPRITHDLIALPQFPDLDEYLARYCREPFVVRGGCRHWSAFSLWSKRAHLERIAGPHRIVPVEIGGDYTAADWGQQILPFTAILDAIFDPPSDRKLYLAQHDLFKQFPDLENDLVIPDLVYSCPPRPTDVPNYQPVSNEQGYLLNAWLGPTDTVSPAHTDPYYNCYAQVFGSKWVWVAPPSCAASMNAFGTSNSDESGFDTGREPDDKVSTSHLLTNTSRIDVTRPIEDMDAKTAAEFRQNVEPVAQQAVLNAGDMLVMPPG
ncbi:hypothetical protein OIV83_003763 [Microbotryomycetes sp. JL201]|nr:hypothetical protein OIV83_003763 [Microbotryomycetes sp. JL201]